MAKLLKSVMKFVSPDIRTRKRNSSEDKEGGGFRLFLHLEELLGRPVFVVFAGTELNYDGGYCCLQCSPLMSSCVVCCIINDVTALKPGRLLSVT